MEVTAFYTSYEKPLNCELYLMTRHPLEMGLSS